MLPRIAIPLLLSLGLQLTHAVHVYLSPASDFYRSNLSPEDASATLSRHLGLDAFEPLWEASDVSHNEELFVGQGAKNALLVTVEEEDAQGNVSQHSLFLPINDFFASYHSIYNGTTFIHSGNTPVNAHLLPIFDPFHISSPGQ
jgi:hypothetical protein